MDPLEVSEDPPALEGELVEEEEELVAEEEVAEEADVSEVAPPLASDPVEGFSPDSLLRAFFRASDG